MFYVELWGPVVRQVSLRMTGWCIVGIASVTGFTVLLGAGGVPANLALAFLDIVRYRVP